MWPYGGKKTFKSNNGNNFQLMGNNYYPHGKQTGAPNKEYFNQVTMSVSVGLNGFPANKIAPDGRIVRQYGINRHDVTDEYINRDRVGNKQRNFTDASKQFHNRNVSQLKVVLNMPSRQRRDSLSQITTAIVKNEVVPPFTQLQNDEILSEHMRKSAVNLQNMAAKLPPLRRNSIQKAKKLEQMTLLQQGTERQLPVKTMDEYSEDEDEDGLPFVGMRLPRRKSSDHFDGTNIIKSSAPTNWKAGLMRRRKSFRLRFGTRNGTQENESTSTTGSDSGYSKMLDRRDSVGRISESIRDQFRAVVQEQLQSQDRQIVSRESGCVDANLAVTGCVGNGSMVKPIPQEKTKSVNTGYKLRHEYGKNLERNWLKNEYMKKQMKEKRFNQSPGDNGYNLRLDIFYSPEPQSDELEDSGEDGANVFVEGDDASMQCGGFSTATAEHRSRRQRFSMQSHRRSTLLDPHEEMEEDTDANSSDSDIEIILKDNQLIQRKTKHKMLKKRKRQIERYRPFLNQGMDAVSEQQETEKCPPLTDHEIRALRLNLKNKEKTKRLTGKRKFLQIANVVFAVIQFRNILRQIRRRKKNIIRKRQQRIAQMVAKRWSKKGQENSEESDRETTPKPTLKDQFLQDVGLKLILDIEKLKIPREKVSDEKGSITSDTDSNNEESNEQNKKQQRSSLSKPNNDRPSKYAAELKKISMKDLENVSNFPKRKKRRHRKRRHSIPKLGRPVEFLVEIPVKQRQRQSRSRGSFAKQKEVRRTYSPPAPKCSCHRVKQTDVMQRSLSQARKCPHQPEVKKPKMKTVIVQTAGLMRTHSLENLSKKRPIELRDLLADIDIPAKEIKLQILARKFRRQRRRRQQIRLSPCRLPERQAEQAEESDVESDSGGTDNISDESDYDFVYGGPFVGSGVMWNQNSKDAKRRTWTEADVDREVKRITRLYHEMKECTYLRLDGLNDAIMERLKESTYKKF